MSRAETELASLLHKDFRKWAGNIGCGDHDPDTWNAIAETAENYLRPTMPTPDLDITTVPDAILIPEAARRNGAKRKTYTGGKFWAQHNPDTPRCRCVGCSKKRAKKRAL